MGNGKLDGYYFPTVGLREVVGLPYANFILNLNQLFARLFVNFVHLVHLFVNPVYLYRLCNLFSRCQAGLVKLFLAVTPTVTNLCTTRMCLCCFSVSVAAAASG